MTSSRYPLSENQKSLWYFQQLDPGNPAFNVVGGMRILGQLDITALEIAVRKFISRHPSLQSIFGSDRGIPYQIIQELNGAAVDRVDITDWSDDQLDRYVKKIVLTPIDISTSPPREFFSLTRSQNINILLLRMHHLITDLWSLSLILIELPRLYEETISGIPAALRTPKRTYFDFIAWQNQMLDGEEGARLWEFWRHRLPTQLTSLNLPTEFSRPQQRTAEAIINPINLSPATFVGIDQISQEYHVDRFSIILSAYSVFLGNLTCDSTIPIGIPKAGRPRRFARVFGYYVNPIPFVSELDPNLSFVEFVSQTSTAFREFSADDAYPFSRIAAQLQPDRSGAQAQLLPVTFSWQKTASGAPRDFLASLLQGDESQALDVNYSDDTSLILEPLELPTQVNPFDLNLLIFEFEDQLKISLDSTVDLYRRETIESMGNMFSDILTGLVADPQMELGKLGTQFSSPKILVPPVLEDTSVLSGGTSNPESSVLVDQTEIEKLTNKNLVQLLTGIWQEILGVLDIHPDDNFFELGGHSLLLIQVVSRVCDHLQIDIPIRTLFDHPTIGGFSHAILELVAEGQVSSPELPVPDQIIRPLHPPLSFSQERMWFIHQLHPQSAAYNIPFGFSLVGSLDIEALIGAFQDLIRRHETLRTTVKIIDGDPIQAIADSAEIGINIVDLRANDRHELEQKLQKSLTIESQKPFDLENGPLIRATLYRVADSEHILLVVMHHVISDVWSLGVLGRDLGTLYEARSRRIGKQLPLLGIQYADFSIWQREWLSAETAETQIDYWKSMLADLPTLEMPTDHARPPIQSYAGCRVYRDINGSLLDNLMKLGLQKNATLSMTLMTAFVILLSRYTGQEDIGVGLPIAYRQWPQVEDLIGTFVNTLVIRSDLTGNPTFLELLERVREVTLNGFANQDIPFEKLVAELQPERDLSYSPLFQVMFEYTNIPTPSLNLPELKWEPLEFDREASQFDLTLAVIDTDLIKQFRIEFSTDLFSEETMNRFLTHFENLLASVLEKPNQELASIDYLTGDEKKHLLENVQGLQTQLAQSDLIHELFRSQARETPNAIAVEYSDKQLTYDELDRNSDNLAAYLSSQGVGTGSIVGICLNSSPELIVGLLAILKSGAAYLPLDPSYPPDRLKYMLEDAETQVLITESGPSPWAQDAQGAIQEIHISELASDGFDDLPDLRKTPPISDDQLAYIIYTSGSTGKPKGVKIKHRSVVNFLNSMRVQPGMSAKDSIINLTSISFDISVLEIFLPLTVGARLILVDRSIASDGIRISRFIEASPVSVLQATPATWRLLIDAGWKGNLEMKALCGGEALPKDLAESLRSRVGELWNMYGPTETTIWSSIDEVNSPSELITIGRPINNTGIFILDENQQLVPMGVIGELYIGGEGLALGYHNQPDLTKKAFVEVTFAGEDEARRLYRTGDTGRLAIDGRIELFGRIDRQIKVRGFRVEVGEIEAVLREHPIISDAAVMPHQDATGHNQLVGIISPIQDSDLGRLNIVNLKRYLSEFLPEYMIPFRYHILEEFPLTPAGKLDRRALAETLGELEYRDQPLVRPVTPTEAALSQTVAGLFGLERVSADDNFFNLGGHSLLAVRLVMRIKEEFNVNLPLTRIYEDGSLSGLAEFIDTEKGLSEWPTLVEIQPDGTGPPFFCIHGITGDVLWFYDLGKCLAPDVPIYALQARGLDGMQDPYTQIENMAAAYVGEIRRLQRDGPYQLAGASFGGTVAYEMARQLEAAGQKVSLLAIFDHIPGNLPEDQLKEASLSQASYIRRIAANFPRWLGDFSNLDGDSRRKRLKRNFGILWKRLKLVWSIDENENSPFLYTAEDIVDAEVVLPPHRIDLIEANFQAISKYQPGLYKGDVTVFLAQTQSLFPVKIDYRKGWEALVSGNVKVVPLPGSHGTIFQSPNVEYLAQKIRSLR